MCFWLTLTLNILPLYSCKGPVHKHDMYIFFSFWRVREAHWFPNKAFQHHPEDSLKCKFLLQSRFSRSESILGISYLCSLAVFVDSWCWCRKTKVQHKGLTGLCDSPPAQPPLPETGETGERGQARGEVWCSVRWEQENTGREKLLSISFLTSPFQARESVGCVCVCMCVYVCHIQPLLLSCFEVSALGQWSPGLLLLSLSVGIASVHTTVSGTYVVSWAHTQVLLLVR